MRRRIWCETVPAAELASPNTVALLRRFHVHPIVAVWPRSVDEASVALARFAEAGLAPALWPMLADTDGRWIGARNAATFCAFVERLVDDLAPREIVLDLEPPIAEVRATIASHAVLAHMLPAPADPASFDAARLHIAALATSLHARGVSVSAAVAMPVLFDSPGCEPGWQERLGTPVDGIAWDHVTPMLYSSMIEGWSRHALRREDTRAFFSWACTRAVARFGRVAGASLGAVGTGAFGDEPTYRTVAELADDVALARAAGIDDLALFDLGGVLRRPPAEAWLEAFTTPSDVPVHAPTSWRSRALVAGGRAAGRAFALVFPRRFVGSRHRRSV
jgi:hypothetical protein